MSLNNAERQAQWRARKVERDARAWVAEIEQLRSLVDTLFEERAAVSVWRRRLMAALDEAHARTPVVVGSSLVVVAEMTMPTVEPFVVDDVTELDYRDLQVKAGTAQAPSERK